MNARRPCPDSALLAAFIDGTLQDYERTAVVTHLSECGECRAVAVTVVEFAEVTALDELWDPPAPPPVVVSVSNTRVRQWASEKTRAPALVIATAATIVAVLIPAFLIYPGWSTRRAVATLVDAAATERPIDARLSGGFTYAPRGVRATTENPSGGRWQLVAAAGRVRESFVDDPAVASRQAVGVAALLVGQLDDAITNLALASSASPTNPEILNDLAAAHYERATLGGRPDDLPRALASVQRALAVAPDLSDAWFNRALIISALGLRAEARNAWQAYLDKDGQSRWSEEARVRLARVGAAPDALKDWKELRSRLANDGTAALAEVVVRKHTSRSRDYIEREALKEWALASTPDAAVTALDSLRLFAHAFLRVSGEKFYADLVANIDAIRLDGNDGRYAEYLAAHRDYLNAAALMAGAKFAEAAPLLARVHSALRRFDSPLALRAAIELGAADYYGGKLAKADAALAGVQADARRLRYTTLVTRSAWLQGMVAFGRNDYGDAQAHYEQMLEASNASGDVDQQVQAQAMLANLLWVVGDAPGAWRHRVEAANRLEEVTNLSVTSAVLVSNAGDAQASGHYDASLLFESTLLAHHNLIPALELQARAQRSRTLFHLGRQHEARIELHLVQTRLNEIADAGFRARVEPDALITEAEVMQSEDPARTAAAARRALALPALQRDPVRAARANLLLANAAIAGRDLAAAETAIKAGVTALEAFQSQPTAEWRLGLSDPAWSLYVRGIELALQRGDAKLAFDYSERRRIKTSFDRRSWGKHVLTLAEVQSRLDGNSAVTVLNQLTHEVQIWVISRDAIHAFSAPLTPNRSAALVAAHLHEMSRSNVLPTSSAQLFDTLLRPAARVLRGIENIVVVADAPYHRVAFAGLWDRSRNRFVVEDHTLASAPNASASAWASARRAGQPASFRQAVVFESPNQQSDKSIRMTGLERQRKMATLYPSVQLRRGEAATPQNLFDDAAAADVLHVAAPIATNDEFPGLSRLMLADHPGRKYSGAVVARHLVQDPAASGATLVALEASAGSGIAPPVEGARGFASALLSAGVSNVVGPVAEVKASDLDQTWLDFHRYYAGGAAAADSLRRAQLTALRESNHRPGPWALVTVFGSTQ